MELATNATFIFNKKEVEVTMVVKGERWEVRMDERYLGDITELRNQYLTPDSGSFITWGSALRSMCTKEQRKIDWNEAQQDYK